MMVRCVMIFISNNKKIITISSNRISYSWKIGKEDGLKFHKKWLEKTEEYDLFLLEKINSKLKELKINRIGIAWNKQSIFGLSSGTKQLPRIYFLWLDKWTKEL